MKTPTADYVSEDFATCTRLTDGAEDQRRNHLKSQLKSQLKTATPPVIAVLLQSLMNAKK